MKKYSVWLASIMVALLMVAGLGAIAAEYGSQSDPLVTLSYIEQVLLPQAKEDVDDQVADSVEAFEEALAEENSTVRSYIDRKLRSFSSGKVDEELIREIVKAVVEQQDDLSSGQDASWTVITVPAGGSVICSSGVQAVLRSGQAVAVTDLTNGLIDLSNGETLANGGVLIPNHLYTSAVQGHGIYVTMDCTLMIAGNYTVY